MSRPDDRLRELDVLGSATDPAWIDGLVSRVRERVGEVDAREQRPPRRLPRAPGSVPWMVVGAAAAAVALLLAPWGRAEAESFEMSLFAAHGMATAGELGAVVSGQASGPGLEMSLEELVLRWEAAGSVPSGRTP